MKTDSTASSTRCAGCGSEIRCGMGGDTPCWCATEFPALMPLTDAEAGCYCRECLGKLIAARHEAASKPLT